MKFCLKQAMLHRHTCAALVLVTGLTTVSWAQGSAENKPTEAPGKSTGDRPGMVERRRMGGGPAGAAANAAGKEWRDPNAEIADLTPEQTQVVVDVVKENMPAIGERLAEAMKSNPDAVRAVIREHPRLLELARMKRHDPKMFDLRISEMKLERQSRDLMLQYRKAQKSGDQAAMDATREQLRKSVEEHFQLRQEIREQELAKLEQRLAQVKSQIESRRVNKDQLILQRLRELTDEGDRAEW